MNIPVGSMDVAIDLVTRQHLFEKNLNYGHGTGHGIAAYLKGMRSTHRTVGLTNTLDPYAKNEGSLSHFET